jgi:hypothetical protein
MFWKRPVWLSEDGSSSSVFYLEPAFQGGIGAASAFSS